MAKGVDHQIPNPTNDLTIGGFTIGIYKIFKAHFKVFIGKFLKNEKAVLIVQKP